MWDRSWLKPRTLDSRFRPCIGTPFELDEVPVIDSPIRALLGRLIACGASAAVAITGIYGMATGHYANIEIVWAVAGPLFGALLAHYLAAARKDI